MRRHAAPVLTRSALAAALLAVAAAPGQAFEASLSPPAFTVAVPGIPAIAAAADSATDSTPPAAASTRFVGSDGVYSVLISIDDAGRPISARECAGAFLRPLLVRPGMPARDSVYRAPLSDALFLVIYLLGDGSQRTLHAHLLAAVASSHCAEAHFSRALQAGEDDDAWRRSFTGASITDRGR